MFLFRLRMLGLLRSLPRRWVRRRPLRLRARSAMTSPTPSECINFLIFLVHLILFIVNKMYVECKLMFIFIWSFNYLMYILIIIWSWHDSLIPFWEAPCLRYDILKFQLPSRVSCRPVLGGDSPPKISYSPPKIFTDFNFIHPEIPTSRLLPPKVLQLPPKRWNPAGNPV